MGSIGDNIRHYRNLAGMSRADLAAKIYKSVPAISNYENGLREPDFDTLSAIASALGVELLDLVLDTDINSSKSVANLPKSVANLPESVANLPESVASLPDPPLALSPAESELLALYRDLNASGQDVLLNTARGLAHNPAMQKDGPSAATRPA